MRKLATDFIIRFSLECPNMPQRENRDGYCSPSIIRTSQDAKIRLK